MSASTTPLVTAGAAPAPRFLSRRAAAAVVVAIAGLVVLSIATTTRAAPPDSVGWWSDRPTAQAQGDGGFEIAPALDGTSVAAIAQAVPSGQVQSAALTLTESGGLNQASGSVIACASGGFAAADPGPIEEAPATECPSGVTLTRSDDGVWSGDVSSLVNGAATAIALVPGPAPADAGPLDAGFTAQFSGADLTVSVAAAPTTQAPVTTAFTPPTTSGGSTFTPPPATSAPTGGSFTPSAPVTTAAPAPVADAPATTVAPAVDAQTSESLDVAGPQIAAGPISGGSGDGKPWIRLLLLIPLSAGVGAAAVYGKQYLEHVALSRAA